MHSVLSCLVTDVIGPATIAEDLIATVAADFNLEGGVAMREYSRSIEVVVRAMGFEKGDKVILSPLAPAAYHRVFRTMGVEPVYADVREEDACLNPESVAEKVNENTKAIFVHAPLGRVPSFSRLAEVGVPLVVDAGEALGARFNGTEIGSFGKYVLLPMEPEGIATAGGGTLVLASEKGALAHLKNALESVGADAFMPDLNASLGLVQWREYPQALESRDFLADIFRQAVMKGRHRTLSEAEDEDSRSVSYSFPVVLASGMNEVRKYARKKGVETLPAFAGRMDTEADIGCPVAKKLLMSTLLFPLYPTLGKKNVQLAAKVLSTLP